MGIGNQYIDVSYFKKNARPHRGKFVVSIWSCHPRVPRPGDEPVGEPVVELVVEPVGVPVVELIFRDCLDNPPFL